MPKQILHEHLIGQSTLNGMLNMTHRAHPNDWFTYAIVVGAAFAVEAMIFVRLVLIFGPQNPPATVEIFCMKRGTDISQIVSDPTASS